MLLLLFNQGASSTQTLTPDLFTNSQTFYAATVTAGSVTLQPGLFTDADAFFGPTISVGGVTLTPSLFSDGDTFFSATVHATYSLTPSKYTNTQTFYSATVSVGAVTLTPSLYSDADTFFAPSISGGTAVLAPALFVNANTFFSPRVVVPSTESDGGGAYWFWRQQYEAQVAAAQRNFIDGNAPGAELVVYFEFYPGPATAASHAPAVTAKMRALFIGAVTFSETIASSAQVEGFVTIVAGSASVEAEASRNHTSKIFAIEVGRPSVFASVAGASFMVEATFEAGSVEGDAFAMAA